MTASSSLAWAIQRSTSESAGTRRTSATLLASFTWSILAWRLSALRRRSSLTVSTPACSSRSEYSSPTPRTRIRSARLHHSSTFFSVTPAFLASSLRPVRVQPACSNVVVPRTPAALSCFADFGPMPSMDVSDGMVCLLWRGLAAASLASAAGGRVKPRSPCPIDVPLISAGGCRLEPDGRTVQAPPPATSATAPCAIIDPMTLPSGQLPAPHPTAIDA